MKPQPGSAGTKTPFSGPTRAIYDTVPSDSPSCDSQQGRRFVRYRLAIFLVLTLVGPAARLAGEDRLTSLPGPPRPSTEADYLRELAARGLDRTILAYCRDRLRSRDLSATVRFTLAEAALRAEYSRALDSVGDDRETFWNQANASLATLSPEFDRLAVALLELVQTTAELERAHLQTHLAEQRPYDDAGRRDIGMRLVAALARRTSLDREIERLLKANPAPTSPDLSGVNRRRRAARLVAGWGELDLLRLTTAAPNTSDLRPDPLRADGLFAAVLKEIGNSARSASPPDPANVRETDEGRDQREEATVGLAIAKLAEGDADAASRTVASLPLPPDGGPLRDRWLDWQIALARRKGTARLPGATLEQQFQQRMATFSDAVPPPELALREFDLLFDEAVRIAAVAPPDGIASPEQIAAFEAHLSAVENRYRERYRTRWVVVATEAANRIRLTSRYGPTVGPLVAAMTSLWETKRFAESVATARRAVTMATQEGRDQVVFNLRWRTGSLLVDREEWETAAEFLRDSSRGDDPRADEAHLLACYALGRAAERSRDRTTWIAALDDHLVRYPNSPTRVDALWQRGQAALADEDWPVAIARFLEVPADSPRAASSLAGMTTAYRRLVQDRDLSPDDRARIVTDARQTLEPRLASQPWADTQVDAALFLAESALGQTPPDYPVAERWLKRVAETAPPASDTPAAWLPRAHQLHVLALAGRGEVDAARQKLRELSPRPKELIEVLAGLDEIARWQPAARTALAQLQRDAALDLDAARNNLGPEEQMRIDRTLAEAFLATGDRAAAVLRYRALAKRLPNDASVHKTLADLLLTSDQPGDRKEALALFRALESGSKPGSVAWLEHRFDHCRALATTGDIAGATKLLKVTRLLYPKLGGEPLSARFAELEKKLGPAK